VATSLARATALLSIRAVLAAAMSLLATTAALASEQPNNPFGEKTVAESIGSLVESWNTVREHIRLDDLIVASCNSGNAGDCAAAGELMRIVEDARRYQGRTMIAHINRSINLAIKPSDGRWSSVLDILKSGSGDCRDYAIAKYAALLKAGVPPDRLRLIIVHKTGSPEYHMVAGVFEDGQWLLLDNLTMLLVKDTDRRDYAPNFVLDRTGVHRYLVAEQRN
jgi:predicted transglutaminase-like cysteine proteinase